METKDTELTDFEAALFSAFSDGWQQYLHGEEVDVAQWAKEHSNELLKVITESKELTIVHHKNKWNWGESIICITNDGCGTATLSFTSEPIYDGESDKVQYIKQATISGVSVYTTERQKGYGNFLLEDCENLAKEAGYKEVYLWSELNSDPYKWYKRHGYIDTNELSYIPSEDNTSNPVVKLMKVLT